MLHTLLIKNFGLRIKYQRKEIGLSQVQLAEKVGVSKTTIQNYESGLIAKGKYLSKLSRALKCSIDWLLIGEESPYVKDEFLLESPSGMTEKELSEYHNKVRGNKSPIYKEEKPDIDPATQDLLKKALVVLTSETDYAKALCGSIKVAHTAVKTETRLNRIESRLAQMEKKQAQASTQTKPEKEITQRKKAHL